LLGRFTNENDINDEGPPEGHPPLGHLPWDTEVTEEEASWTVTTCKDKAPGADGITTRLLRAAWPSIGQSVRALYEGSLKHRHFPEIFKLAEVILLPKPGRDQSTAKGWRPIALLSCLGKGLERLVAKRMAHTALERQAIPRQLFGALPKRSANDLVACVVHDIEHTLKMRQKAVLVTLDVQGAFDAVLYERLLKRMRNMGWPEHAIIWIRSFLRGRSARVRFDSGITEPRQLECGLPQGSPLSPILFLFYMAELVAGNNRRFGYADDLAILGTGPTLDVATARAQEEVDRVLRWANENAVTFDPTKAEAIYFHCPRSRQTTVPEIRIGDRTITASEEIRWLGIFLDKRLNFRRHAAEWA
ncbi:hypothetical protein K3495_g15993, partial [Podosphaera aphanis]